MYQMLTGELPYDTPAPADLDKLMSGELVTPPRLRNPLIPKTLSDIIMRAMAPAVTARYQRAPELLADLMAARAASQPRRTPAGQVAKAEAGGGRSIKDDAHGIQTRLRAREALRRDCGSAGNAAPGRRCQSRRGNRRNGLQTTRACARPLRALRATAPC